MLTSRSSSVNKLSSPCQGHSQLNKGGRTARDRPFLVHLGSAIVASLSYYPS